jgi:hypothetical protein
MDRDSSVVIAIRYGLDGPGIDSVGARFSAPVQTGPAARPASCTMGAEPLSRVKSGRGLVLTTHPHLAPRLKKERSYTSTSRLGLTACTRVNFTLALSVTFILSSY